MLQNHRVDEQCIMEKPVAQGQPEHPQHQQQQPLKCPRCDSANTKFCYYNNYSLSQPRHFCKACKRYWTRGGTLRNVPVGGGCRKNKRLKRPPSSASAATTAIDAPPPTTSSSTSSNPSGLQMEMNPSSINPVNNPLFYGLPTNLSELTMPNYPRFNSRVSGFDQLGGVGLGFSSSGGLMMGGGSDVVTTTSTSSLLSSYPSSSSPTMASLLTSTLHHHHHHHSNKFNISSSGLNLKDIIRDQPTSFQGLLSYEDLQMPSNEQAMKEVKMEQTQIQQIGNPDPSLFWNSASVGAWLDPTNIGSSVPSLI